MSISSSKLIVKKCSGDRRSSIKQDDREKNYIFILRAAVSKSRGCSNSIDAGRKRKFKEYRIKLKITISTYSIRQKQL
jgi:hypothetical protein